MDWPAWTYVFLPNGSAWTLPPAAKNDRSTWSITTHRAAGQLAGPRVNGPQDREWVRVVVYATTGQAVSE